MKLLTKAKNESAFLKAGLLGFPGTGKTYTASMLAIAIAKRYGEGKPIAFFDTETGSDFLLPKFETEGIELYRIKSPAFSDLINAAKEAEKECSVLIVDSITHVWRELCDTYCKKLRIKRLMFQHWAALKTEWQEWTRIYLNCNLHVIVCGRAGYEYDFETADDGKKELIKTGTKMKVETEFGFEPSLLIEMERAKRSPKPGAGWIHRAHILKDRTDTINGLAFDFGRLTGGYSPGDYQSVEKAFEPVIASLALGGTHLGIRERTSNDRFNESDGQLSNIYIAKQKDIALDEIKEVLNKHHSGTTNDAKKAKADLLEQFAGTRSWKKIEALSYEQCLNLRDELWIELEGCGYGSKNKTGNGDGNEVSEGATQGV